MVKGEATLKIRKVLKYYWQNGLLLDIFGLLPLNLILGIISTRKPHILVIAFLRSLRIISAWKSMQIFGQFESFLKKHNLIMHIIKAFLLLYFLWHWTACLWYFMNSNLEEGENTWRNKHQLSDKGVKV